MNHSAPAQSPDQARVVRARNAVAMVFALNGLAIASWMGRIPEVRDLLGLTPGEIGRVLLALAAGSLVALPTSGLVVSRIGAARTVAGGSVLVAIGLTLAGLGADTLGAVPAVAAGLVLIGYGSGSWDVAMNVRARRSSGCSAAPSCRGSTPRSVSARWPEPASEPARRPSASPSWCT